MPDALSDAKAALANANKAFPSSNQSSGAAPAPKAVSKPVAPNLGQELAAKKTMVDKAKQALPKMHKGGTIPTDGAYQLKAGEHVLTAPEAAKARTHALMASGMKSLAKPVARKGAASIGAIEPMPKTTFTDKDLTPRVSPGAPGQKISSDNAKPSGSISAIPNAPRQLKSVQGTTKVSVISKA
jgi:hypothetical protein